MAIYTPTIPPSLTRWILAQHLLWVATSPLSSSGHINVSPKGGKHFGILSPSLFWYLDLTGSGVETIAHLHENGRICIMFIAFSGPPRIVRLWGSGRVVERGCVEFDEVIERIKVKEREREGAEGDAQGERDKEKREIKILPGTRSVILVDVEQVGSSCGWSVPFFEFKGYRTQLDEFFERKQKAFEGGKEGESMDRYWAWKSQLSVDGLPGMKRGYEYAQKHQIEPLKKFVGKAAPKGPRRASGGVEPIQILLVALLSFVIGVVMTLTVVSPEFVRRVQNKEMAFR
ncbi:pyridoxamine phosphate oxidase family protein [Sporormia fimetaria CBS 119925]|uniref:Pyridoxamine phosphate oxidase family protein n=1 Tax=Sporormia fimetaria CBS 119925 TaxID=1340428 RepID=A0A6A6V1J2_9PLEO|nr:pyridoxamine phosphate oxidase family protein [Sporormia fimetaria CBS 119925]